MLSEKLNGAVKNIVSTAKTAARQTTTPDVSQNELSDLTNNASEQSSAIDAQSVAAARKSSKLSELKSSLTHTKSIISEKLQTAKRASTNGFAAVSPSYKNDDGSYTLAGALNALGNYTKNGKTLRASGIYNSITSGITDETSSYYCPYYATTDNADGDSDLTSGMESDLASLQEWVSDCVAKGYPDSYIVDNYSLDNYSYLTKASKKTYSLTHAVDYIGDSTIYGMIYKARNEDATGDILENAANYFYGNGNQYVPDKSTEAALDATSEYYNPYANGATYNTSSFTEKYGSKYGDITSEDWLSSAGATLMANSTDKNVLADYAEVKEAVETTNKAKSEFASLKEKAAALIAEGATADEVYTMLQGSSSDSLQLAYPTLYKLEKARSGGGYLNTTEEIDFAMPYFKYELEQMEADNEYNKSAEAVEAEYNADTALAKATQGIVPSSHLNAIVEALNTISGKELSNTELTQQIFSLFKDKEGQEYTNQVYSVLEQAGIAEKWKDKVAAITAENAKADEEFVMSAVDPEDAETANKLRNADLAYLNGEAVTSSVGMAMIEAYPELNVTGKATASYYSGNSRSSIIGGSIATKENKDYVANDRMGEQSHAIVNRANEMWTNGVLSDDDLHGLRVEMMKLIDTAEVNGMTVDEYVASGKDASATEYFNSLTEKLDAAQTEYDAKIESANREAASEYSVLIRAAISGEADETTNEQLGILYQTDIRLVNDEGYTEACDNLVQYGLDYMEESGMADKLSYGTGIALNEEVNYAIATQGLTQLDWIEKVAVNLGIDFNTACEYMGFDAAQIAQDAYKSSYKAYEQMSNEYVEEAKEHFAKFPEYDYATIFVDETKEANADLLEQERGGKGYEAPVEYGEGTTFGNWLKLTGETGIMQHVSSLGDTVYFFTRHTDEELENMYRSLYDPQEFAQQLLDTIDTIKSDELKSSLQSQLANYNGDIYKFKFDITNAGIQDLKAQTDEKLELLYEEAQDVMDETQYNFYTGGASALNSALSMAEAAGITAAAGAMGLTKGIASFLGTALTFGAAEGYGEMGNAILDAGGSKGEALARGTLSASVTGMLESLCDPIFNKVIGGGGILVDADFTNSAFFNSIGNFLYNKTGSKFLSGAVTTGSKLLAKSVFNLAGEEASEISEELVEDMLNSLIKGKKNYTSADLDASAWDTIKQTFISTLFMSGTGVVGSTVGTTAKAVQSSKTGKALEAQAIQQTGVNVEGQEALANMTEEEYAARQKGKVEQAEAALAEQDEADTSVYEACKTAVANAIKNYQATDTYAKFVSAVKQATAKYKLAENAIIDGLRQVSQTTGKSLKEAKEALKLSQNALEDIVKKKTDAQALYDMLGNEISSQAIAPAETITQFGLAVTNLNNLQKQEAELTQEVQKGNELVSQLEQQRKDEATAVVKQANMDAETALSAMEAQEQTEQMRQAEIDALKAMNEKNVENLFSAARETVKESGLDSFYADLAKSAYEKAKNAFSNYAEMKAKVQQEIADMASNSFKGFNVEFADMGEAGGCISVGNKTITLNSRSTIGALVNSYVSHEIAHIAERSGKYSELVDAVTEKVYGKKYSEGQTQELIDDVNSIQKQYADAGKTLSPKQAMKELMCELFARNILQNKQGMGLAEQSYTSVNWADFLKNGGTTYASTVTEWLARRAMDLEKLGKKYEKFAKLEKVMHSGNDYASLADNARGYAKLIGMYSENLTEAEQNIESGNEVNDFADDVAEAPAEETEQTPEAEEKRDYEAAPEQTAEADAELTKENEAAAEQKKAEAEELTEAEAKAEADSFVDAVINGEMIPFNHELPHLVRNSNNEIGFAEDSDYELYANSPVARAVVDEVVVREMENWEINEDDIVGRYELNRREASGEGTAVNDWANSAAKQEYAEETEEQGRKDWGLDEEPSVTSIGRLEGADAIFDDYPSDVQFSLAYNQKLLEDAQKLVTKYNFITKDELNVAEEQRKIIHDYMTNPDNAKKLKLPPDIMGKTFVSNASYGGSIENSLVCIRSLAQQSVLNEISEKLGRPLTVAECLYVSQETAKYTKDGKTECFYCYVAADRMAFREFLGSYIQQRTDLLNGQSYKDYLHGRADNETQQKRVELWKKFQNDGVELISPADVASLDKLRDEMASLEKQLADGLGIQKFIAVIYPNKKNGYTYEVRETNKSDDTTGHKVTTLEKVYEQGGELARIAARYIQLKDAWSYAQSASWGKAMKDYVAYNGEILRMSSGTINKLKNSYGLRMYSYSDFSPAFILENMQMITDAAVRGLPVLAYTKELDFVKIFAKTGANINISVFAYRSPNGEIIIDEMEGAEIEEAKKLRKQYPNVGITLVATDDAITRWGMEQDWADVVIPYHTVRTGTEVANWRGYVDKKDVQEDKTDSGGNKSLKPKEHNNDLKTFISLCVERNLKPRFSEFLNGYDKFVKSNMDEDAINELVGNNKHFMKLVNETRRSYSETTAVVPSFDTDAAISSLNKMGEEGGYNPPMLNDVELQTDIAEEIADNIAMREKMGVPISAEIDSFADKYINARNAAGFSAKELRQYEQQYRASQTANEQQARKFSDAVGKIGQAAQQNSFFSPSRTAYEAQMDAITKALEISEAAGDAKEYRSLVGQMYKALDSRKYRDASAVNSPINTVRQLAAEVGTNIYEGNPVGVKLADGSMMALAERYSDWSNQIFTDKVTAKTIPPIMADIAATIDKQMNFDTGNPDISFGEFFYAYMTNANLPDTLKPIATSFEAALKDNPSLEKAISRRRAQLLHFLAGSNAQKLFSMMRSYSDKTPNSKNKVMQKLRADFVDKTVYADAVDEWLNYGRKPSDYDNRFSRAANETAQYMKRVETWLNGECVDLDAHATGAESLKSIMKRTKCKGRDAKLVSAYLLAKEAIDRWNNDKAPFESDFSIDELPTAPTKEELEAFVAEVEANTPRIAQAAQGIYGWWDSFMENIVVAEGLISQEEYDRMKRDHPHYAPLKRQDGVYHFANAVGGSSEKVMNPLECMAKMQRQFIGEAARNRLAVEFDNIYRNTPGMGWLAAQTEQSDTAFGEVRVPTGDNVVTVHHPDASVTYYTFKDEGLAGLMNGATSRAQVNGVLKAMQNVTRAMSMLSTGVNLLFAGKNALRDFQHSVNRGSWAYSYVDGLFKWSLAMWDVTKYAMSNGKKGSQQMRDFANLGGYGYERVSFDREVGAREFNRTVFEGSKAAAAGRKVLNFIEAKTLNEIIETTSRFAEYKYGKVDTKSGPNMEAFMNAREATVNFDRGGSSPLLTVLKSCVPFLNATIQGMDSAYRMVTDKGERKYLPSRMTKTVLNNAITGAISALLMMKCGDDDDKEAYLDLEDSIKQQYILLPGRSLKGSRDCFRIPVSQDFFDRLFYEVGRKATEELLTGNTDDTLHTGIMADIIQTAYGASLGSVQDMTSIISPVWQVATNKNWYGSSIVSTSLQNMEYRDQYDTTTPTFYVTAARYAGEMLDRLGANDKSLLRQLVSSPIAMEYWTKQYTGIIGQVLPAMMSADKYTGEITPLASLGDVVKNAWTIDMDSSSAILDAYYDADNVLDQIVSAANSGKAGAKLSATLTEEQQKAAIAEATQLVKSGGTFYKANDEIEALWDLYGEIQADTSMSVTERDELCEEKVFAPMTKICKETLAVYSEYTDSYMGGNFFKEMIALGSYDNTAHTYTPAESALKYKLDDRYVKDYEDGAEYMSTALLLYDNNSGSSTLIPSPNYEFSSEGVEYKLSGEETELYDNAYYAAYQEAANALLASDEFNSATEEEKVSKWKNVHKTAHSAAKQAYLESIE